MNVNTEVKGTLAKLLATENLTVEHRQVSTASFDVNNRVLILPIWKNASSIVYDLLVGHEVGHALYTPNLPIDAPKAFVNVIEDARIERMMKQTYPGLKKSFFEGYRELWHQDFFGVLDEDINALAFIDRINLYFKGNSEIEFSEEEKVWVNRVATTKTFQDVLDLSQELYDYVSDKQESNLEKNMSFDLNDEPANGDEVEQDNNLEPNESEDGEDQDGEQQEGGSPHPFKRDDTDPDLDTPNFSAGDLSGGTVDETESVTDEALRQALETLVDEEAEDWTYLTTPEVNLDKIVTKYDRIQEDLYYFFEGQAVESEYQEKIHKDNLEWSYKSYNEYKKEAQRSVNYLVKQFEMKKSADQYKRAATSKTGVIDTNSLYKYKITEDVFKRITTVPDGKNHGLIMFLDWSGSMQHVLQDTLKQTYNLVWFCRKAGIPFRVYGFQNTHGSCGPHSGVKPTPNSLAIMEDFALLEFFSSRQNAKSLDKSLKLLWTQVQGMGYGSVCTYMQKYTLGGTPLGEAVMCAPKLVEKLKQVENVTKVNVVALTDGESNPLSHLVEHDGDEYYYRSKGEISVRSLYRGRRMKYILRDKKSGYSRELNPSQFITTQEIVSFYRKITDYNWIGIRICSKSELGRVSRMLSYEDGQLLDQQWKKYKYASIKDQVGFDQSFYIPNQGIGSTTDEIEVKQKGEVATKAELNRAFKKHMGSKKSNKTILNAFIEQIA